MSEFPEAFLDIETTGLHPHYCDVTVVGIFLTDGCEERCVQIVGEKIYGDAILESLEGVQNLYTYNGHRFDLPFIRSRYGIDLESGFNHCDLMYYCWRTMEFLQQDQTFSRHLIKLKYLRMQLK